MGDSYLKMRLYARGMMSFISLLLIPTTECLFHPVTVWYARKTEVKTKALTYHEIYFQIYEAREGERTMKRQKHNKKKASRFLKSYTDNKKQKDIMIKTGDSF